jgi:hypothetical protein
MATETTTLPPKAVEQKVTVEDPQKPEYRQPLKLNGALDQFKSFDVTPVIGKEFPDAKLVDWLNAPNSDELIRDLAVTSPSIHLHPATPAKLNSLLSSLPTRRSLLPSPRLPNQRPPKAPGSTSRRALW